MKREKRKKRRDTIRASMKRRRQNPKHVPLHLMILVTVAAFLILVITMILVVTVIWLAMEAGMIHSSFSERAARNFAEEKRVLLFELPGHTSKRYLYLLYRKNFVLRPCIQAFSDHIRKYYAATLARQ